MKPIYPSTALKNQQREIKAIADSEPVYITENGRGKYVFMAESVYESRVKAAVEEALYEQRLSDALGESRQDFREGRFYSTRDELLRAVTDKRGNVA